MREGWFQRRGWFYFPVSLPGWCVVLCGAAFCATVFLAVDRHSHSVSDTLYGFFSYAVSCFLLIDWLGSRTSKKE